MIGTREEQRAEVVGRLLHELETKKTLDGEPLPDARNYEQDDWYEALGTQLLAVLKRKGLS